MRVGVDFGKVIGLDDCLEPVPLALPAMRHLVGRCGQENVFVVSKAGPEMELRIRGWLDAVCFYEATKLLASHVVFVRTYEAKAAVCRELALDWFVDDHVKVVRALADVPQVKRVFWFGAHPSDIRLLSSRCARGKVVVATRGWACVLKALTKPPAAPPPKLDQLYIMDNEPPRDAQDTSGSLANDDKL